MNKVAVVTGTSSGFGLLISLELAKCGYEVIATMRDVENSKTLKDVAEKDGVLKNIHIYELDVSNEHSIQRFERYLNQFSRIDLLVNNAGYALGGFTEDIPLEEMKRQYDTNVFGVVAVTQAVLPYMRKQQSGKVINMSSISGRIGFPGMSAYVSSKHALEGISECMRLELKPFGISVVLIEPGSYQTSIWSKAKRVHTNAQSPYYETERLINNRINHNQSSFGDPMDVVKLVVKIANIKKPRLRYSIGKGVKVTIVLKNILPWSLWENIILKTINKKLS
jgi:NAD(P)-dependent dehydrogenase (short-subunit alcohol dehydrogenase family)